ncbi:LOW QUALITY PROTEIN: uncharacterized protein LOC129224440 [Uloborus diversus]|uniref:LOW QUALITY PROTEIN: uncharacterized protein LOC129224440 n=1 Tax=Uloborus diversus TaxID=327109 RepID=UPI00240A30A7|nr:LOW QUALITY PROTEIN: uncharacterized protein LOC129224440 [Uloborus diversus]
MPAEHSRIMLCPSECGALPSVVCPDRSVSNYPHMPAPSIWDKKAYPSLYKLIQDYSLEKNLQRMNSCFTAIRHPEPNKEPYLPLDPRQWSREDVARWIQYTCSNHQLPSVHLDRFPHTGKALCLMSIDMFVSRVPLGGKLLYKDFQLRLSRALYC